MSAGKFTGRSSATLGIMPRFSVPKQKFYALRLSDMLSASKASQPQPIARAYNQRQSGTGPTLVAVTPEAVHPMPGGVVCQPAAGRHAGARLGKSGSGGVRGSHAPHDGARLAPHEGSCSAVVAHEAWRQASRGSDSQPDETAFWAYMLFCREANDDS